LQRSSVLELLQQLKVVIAGNAEQMPDAASSRRRSRKSPIFIRQLGLLDIVLASFDSLVALTGQRSDRTDCYHLIPETRAFKAAVALNPF
jgi:hypothetical protein